MKLTSEQIEEVVNWMNEWEQLKDTAIPIRFKEHFTEHDSNTYKPVRQPTVADGAAGKTVSVDMSKVIVKPPLMIYEHKSKPEPQ